MLSSGGLTLPIPHADVRELNYTILCYLKLKYDIQHNNANTNTRNNSRNYFC